MKLTCLKLVDGTFQYGQCVVALLVGMIDDFMHISGRASYFATWDETRDLKRFDRKETSPKGQMKKNTRDMFLKKKAVYRKDTFVEHQEEKC